MAKNRSPLIILLTLSTLICLVSYFLFMANPVNNSERPPKKGPYTTKKLSPIFISPVKVPIVIHAPAKAKTDPAITSSFPLLLAVFSSAFL